MLYNVAVCSLVLSTAAVQLCLSTCTAFHPPFVAANPLLRPEQDYYRAVASEVMDGGATGGGGGGGAPFRERAAWQPRGGGGGHGHGAEGGAAGADFAGAPGTGPARVVAEGDVGTTILKLRGLPVRA